MKSEFKHELTAHRLDKFPQADHENFELYVKAIRESADRIRLQYAYDEEPSNTFSHKVNTNEK